MTLCKQVREKDSVIRYTPRLTTCVKGPTGRFRMALRSLTASVSSARGKERINKTGKASRGRCPNSRQFFQSEMHITGYEKSLVTHAESQVFEEAKYKKQRNERRENDRRGRSGPNDAKPKNARRK